MRFKPRYAAIIVLTLAACISGPLRQGYGAEGPGQPVSLKCEYLVNPLGIDVRQPRLSWVLEHSKRGQMQTAYQVQVATSPALLEQGNRSIDSGAIDIRILFPGNLEQRGRVQMPRRVLNDADQQASLIRDAYPPRS